MVINQTQISEIKEKLVVIVQFGPPAVNSGTRAGEYYQVTIDPGKVSPDGLFIRFGHTQGDEIVGWQRANALTIVSVLGRWESDEPPLLHYSKENVISIPLLITQNEALDTQ